MSTTTTRQVPPGTMDEALKEMRVINEREADNGNLLIELRWCKHVEQDMVALVVTDRLVNAKAAILIDPAVASHAFEHPMSFIDLR